MKKCEHTRGRPVWYTCRPFPSSTELMLQQTAWRAGGKVSLVVPEFPEMCVCCGSSEQVTRVVSWVQVDGGEAAGVRVPSCQACRRHATRCRLTRANRLTICLFVGVLLPLFLATIDTTTVGVEVGILPTLAGLWAWAEWRVARHPEWWYGKGHAGPVHLAASPVGLTVGTYNRAFVEKLEQLNGDRFFA